MQPVRLTHRPEPADLAEAVRRVVAECLEEAAEEHAVTTTRWLEDVAELRRTVAELSRARREGAAADRTAALRERVSVWMVQVMPVHRAARVKLEVRLGQDGNPALRAWWVMLGGDDLQPVDPWLRHPITETVHDVLAARISPARLAPAA